MRQAPILVMWYILENENPQLNYEGQTDAIIFAAQVEFIFFGISIKNITIMSDSDL